MSQCKWNKAWIGQCKEEAGESGYCEEHTKECVSCGKPATHDCAETGGPLVCGAPLCDDCTHTTHPDGTNGIMMEWPEGLKSHCKKGEQKYKPWYMRKPVKKRVRVHIDTYMDVEIEEDEEDLYKRTIDVVVGGTHAAEQTIHRLEDKDVRFVYPDELPTMDSIEAAAEASGGSCE